MSCIRQSKSRTCPSKSNNQMTIKLTYFNARGRGELSRLIAKYGKLEFEDNRVEMKDWGSLKASTPYGSLPMVEVDGIVIGQSIAVARFLAKRAGIAGKDDIEQGVADGIVDFTRGFMDEIPKARFPKSPEDKLEIAQDFVNVKAPSFCETAEKLLKKNGGTYFVGDSITYADIAVAHFFDLVDYPEEFAYAGVPDVEARFELVAKYPLLQKHREMVNNLPGIKEWIESRPKTPM